VALPIGSIRSERHQCIKERLDLAVAHLAREVGDQLARIALAKGDLPTALAKATKATAFKSNRSVSFMTLGNVQRAMKDYPASIASFDQALQAAREAREKPVINTNAWRGVTRSTRSNGRSRAGLS